MKLAINIFAATAVICAVPAAAAPTVVNSVASIPSATRWGTIASENTGTIAVTNTVARDGTGSLEIMGDRTRAQLGIQYNPVRTTIGNLSDTLSLTFDWRIAGDSVSALNPNYTPALRLLIQNGNARQELIWEGAYNGTYGNTQRDTWYSTSASDLFYITGGSVNAGQTIAQWAAQLTGATVSGISVGAGSSAGVGYHAFADNVTYTTTSGSTTYNFDPAATAAVPEPASWGMMILGMGAVGYAARRRKVTTRVSYAA